MISPEQAAAGFERYAETNLMCKVEPWRQFVAGMAIGTIASNARTFVLDCGKIPVLHAMHVIDDSGNIDIDKIYDAAIKQIDKQTRIEVDIPVMGRFAFNRDDLEMLYREMIK